MVGATSHLKAKIIAWGFMAGWLTAWATILVMLYVMRVSS